MVFVVELKTGLICNKTVDSAAMRKVGEVGVACALDGKATPTSPTLSKLSIRIAITVHSKYFHTKLSLKNLLLHLKWLPEGLEKLFD